jgi:undecaprenyl-diphosphatase
MPKAIRSIINQCNKVDTDWCIKLNRLSKNLYIQNFFNFISWLGNGKIWYLIIFLIPFISDSGIPYLNRNDLFWLDWHSNL